MVTKNIFDLLLRRVQRGAVEVVYWDGTRRVYGAGKPYFSLTIKSPHVIRAIIKNQSLGIGESYMNGEVEIDGGIDQLIRLVAENEDSFKKFSLAAATSKRQKNIKDVQQKQIQHHYDLGNDFYKLWLDKAMVYSCAYFKSPADSLEKAQQQKIQHVLRKLQLSKNMTLLEIGSGWGDLMLTAARDYGIKGLGLTLSKEQHQLSNQRAKQEGLDHLVSFKLMNYQDLAEGKKRFDRIVSVGMYEHVGQGNHGRYFEAVKRMLNVGGLTVLHTITQQKPLPNDPWVDKYIFPGGHLPTIAGTVEVATSHGFRLSDYENLRLHYAMTLDEWQNRFEANAGVITEMYDERFVRMWRFYLAVASGSFRYGALDLSQFVFTKGINNEMPLTREHLYAPVS